MNPIEKELVERFFRYVAIPSQSDFTVATVPSTPGQRILAEVLAAELKDMGLTNIHMDAHANLTATLPATKPGLPVIGFVAHLDTVDVALSPEIKPQILPFDGNDLCLNHENNTWLRLAEHPELAPYKGMDIICTNGTSVLGADNKAAIAVIMTTLAQLQAENAPHGELKVAFVPDEEIGLKGSNLLDLNHFKVDFAYTIDCCAVGELVYETFNAGSARIDITGVTAHPMSAKNVLVNPLLVATDIVNCFDRGQTPEQTDRKEGYFWFTGMRADASTATLTMNIRDFNRNSYEARKQYIENTLQFARQRHPRAQINWSIEDVYSNIADSLGQNRHPIDLMYQAAAALGIETNTIAMRGGTDGSALSARGLVTPNYFTGAHNFHSWAEFLPVPSFHKSYAMTRKLLELAWAGATGK